MSVQGEYDRNQRAAERQHDGIVDLGNRLTEASMRDAQEGLKYYSSSTAVPPSRYWHLLAHLVPVLALHSRT